MHLEKLPIYVLQSAGHSGIEWTHSLLDSHSEILILPAFSFYRTIYKLEIRSFINLKKKNNKELAEIFANTFLNDISYQVKRRVFIRNEKDKEIFRKNMYLYLGSSKEEFYKKIFYAIHYAFIKLYNIDVSKKKCIVIHEHVSWHYKKYDNLYNAKHILVFRNPKAAIGGSFYKLRTMNKINKTNAFQFDHIILDMLCTFEILKKNKKNFFYLKNERMHLNLFKEMNNLCNWMKIKYEDCLLEQTFLGVEWRGESSYLAWDEVDKKPSEEYYLEKNVEARWRGVLSKEEILLIETIFFKYMKKLEYKFDNKFNLIKFIKGYFYYFSIYINQDKYYFSKILIIIRNIIRKIFILLLTYRVAKIFKFK